MQGFDLGSPSLSSDMTVIIYLVDKNNNLPVFSQLQYSITIPEDTPSLTLVLQVAATDGDLDRRARLHYSVEPGLSTARTEQGHLPLSDWAGMFSSKTSAESCTELGGSLISLTVNLKDRSTFRPPESSVPRRIW